MRNICIKTGAVLLLSTLCLSIFAQKQQQSVSRKDELILESIINNFILRNQVKREFPFPYKFEAYASVLAESINVYVYCWLPNDKEALFQGKVSDMRVNPNVA